MDTSDELLAARDAIRERGWLQNDLRSRDGKVCIVGALHEVVPAEAEQKAFRHLGRYCIAQYSLSPAIVNDVMLTSEDEACDLLEAAAKWDGGTDG